ncbi:hypothetical protein HOP50_10g59560 [Chloropicon primus]|uniref:Uncharacterized protein n=1 Tax=Chloropicon primus TaxID=1764295 RepID=A0A5B8MSZ6_9CHLO|nr:hypothetical protein A3770_10p59350 [Chloropicon primus]UPR02629.1 hypothetical protein HOP50_10g59560 [Chloropicon primus]|eukprot:QDZ23417.1 hypothetical protein A3770_10p59350 [Chloropicon primus]
MYIIDVVLMLLQPTLYIFWGGLTLAHFQILYQYALHWLTMASKSEYTSPFAVYFQTITANLERVMGAPNAMKFNFTHVLLASLLIAALVSVEKLRIIIDRSIAMKYKTQ